MTRLLLVFAVFVVAVQTSLAYAQVPGDSVPEFLPASPWIVGKTQLAQSRGLKGIKLPCVMVNEFNNGFTVRLSGGGHHIMALAIDFRQDIFRQGARYPAVFKTDTGFIQSLKGSAFSPSILIFNMRDVKGIYNALAGANVLGLEIGQNKMRFALSDMRAALSDLESCYSGEGDYPMTLVGSPGQTSSGQSGQKPQQQPQEVAQAVPMPAVSQELPESFDDITGGAAPTKAPEFVPPAEDEVYISRRDSQRAAAMKQAGRTSRSGAFMKSTGIAEQARTSGNDGIMLWTAREGEDMQAVLERWGTQAGVEVEWQASASRPIMQDVTLSGSFENAVQTLLAQNAMMGPLQGQLQDHGQNKTISAGQPMPLSSSVRVAPGRHSSEMGGGNAAARWMAPAGGSLQVVLEQWSSRNNVDLQWFADQGFAVKQTIAQNGSYEEALGALLSQYEGDKVRPAARLNTDPNTGLRVLVIETERL